MREREFTKVKMLSYREGRGGTPPYVRLNFQFFLSVKIKQIAYSNNNTHMLKVICKNQARNPSPYSKLENPQRLCQLNLTHLVSLSVVSVHRGARGSGGGGTCNRL